MTTENKKIDICDIPVQLPCYVSPSTSNDVTVNTVISKNAVVGNKTTELKRSTRMSRKRIFQNKLIIGNDDEQDNSKKKKC